MDTLPDRADPDYLHKQAKSLLRLFRAGDPVALARLARFIPASAGRMDAEIARLDLRLRDARSSVAHQYGFPSSSELSLHVKAQVLARGDHATAVWRWLDLAYGGDVIGSSAAARPSVATRVLRDMPVLPTTSGLPVRPATSTGCRARWRPTRLGSTVPADR